jgi:ATP-dependent exoDNAse (exonuclease V) alpha subunit
MLLQMFIDIEKALQWVQQSQKRSWQRSRGSIRKAITSKVLVITGDRAPARPPCLTAHSILEQKNQRILLASPTGRVAKRLAKIPESKTIHVSGV